jgi:O-antigen/teichoic acid export membrane protein
MTLQVLCPSCGEVTTFSASPVDGCAHCHVPFPASLRATGERAVVREATQKPVLLVLGQWAATLGAAIVLLLLALAPFDVGRYTIHDEPVSGPEFLHRAGLLFTTLGGVLVAIAVGLWREREWSRPLMVLTWIVLGVGTLVSDLEPRAGGLVGGTVTMLITAGLATWYLYHKRNVVAYYRVIERRSRPRRRAEGRA